MPYRNPPPGMTGVRIRNASDPAKSLAQYEAIRDSGTLAGAVVLVQHTDGNMEVLGQGAPLPDIARMMLGGMQAVQHAMEAEERKAGRPWTPPDQRAAPPPPPPPRRPTGYTGVPGGVVEKLWRSFQEKLLSAPDVPDIQRQEMRRAFYAGAQGLFHAMVNLPGDGEDITDADMENMSKVQEELEAFGKAVLEGRA